MANRHFSKIRSMPKMNNSKKLLKLEERYLSNRSYILDKCLMEIFELKKGKELLEMELQLNKLNADVKKEFIKHNFNSCWKYYFTDEMDVSEDTRLN